MGREIIKNPSWWKRRSGLERNLILLLAILFILALILLIVLIVTYASTDPEICTTPGCVQAANKILETIDRDVNPCDNFYNFVCGKFIQNSIIPEDKSSIDQFSIIDDLLTDQVKPLVEEEIDPKEPKPFQTMKKIYKACMNTELIEKIGTKRLEQILQQAGGWPVVLGEKWKENDFYWLDTVLKLRKIGFSANYLLQFYIATDLKDSNTRMINLDESSLSLSREYLIEGLNNSVVKAYYAYMVNVATVFGAPKETAQRELMESLNLEINLAKLKVPKEELRNVTITYNPMKISELQKRYPFINWLQYFNNILYPYQKVTSEEVINVNIPDFIDKLEALIAATPKRVQANYMFWKVVSGAIKYMTAELRNLQLQYSSSISGTLTRPPRWRECVDTAAGSLHTAAAAFYIRKYFDEDAKNEAVKMVKNIREEFLGSLKNVGWMDEKTKERAIEKAQTMKEYIAYPEKLNNITKIEEMFEGLEANTSDYLGSALNFISFSNKLDIKLLRKPVNETIWMEYSQILTANAYYSGSENSINFPAGILQGVFFMKDRPRYMNYGAIGFVIGHEITHGFDDKGRQQDKDGNLVDWWAPKTEDKFVEKAQCIIDQYGNYTVPELTTKEKEIHLNGIASQGETIADNGGIKLAYLAYQKLVSRTGAEPKLPGLSEYTPNQLFWMSCANSWCEKNRPKSLQDLILTESHPPALNRIIGAFSNMEQFSQDFNCELGSNMNPINKCSVW